MELSFFSAFSFQVSRILYSFSTAFRRSSRPTDIRDSAPSTRPDSDLYTFTVTLEIKEEDGKGNYRYLFHTDTHLEVWAIQSCTLTRMCFTQCHGATVLIAPFFTVYLRKAWCLDRYSSLRSFKMPPHCFIWSLMYICAGREAHQHSQRMFLFSQAIAYKVF